MVLIKPETQTDSAFFKPDLRIYYKGSRGIFSIHEQGQEPVEAEKLNLFPVQLLSKGEHEMRYFTSLCSNIFRDTLTLFERVEGDLSTTVRTVGKYKYNKDFKQLEALDKRTNPFTVDNISIATVIAAVDLDSGKTVMLELKGVARIHLILAKLDGEPNPKNKILLESEKIKLWSAPTWTKAGKSAIKKIKLLEIESLDDKKTPDSIILTATEMAEKLEQMLKGGQKEDITEVFEGEE